MMILITGMIPVLITQEKYTNEYITGVLCYLVIIALLILCIIFKLLTHIQSRKNEYQCLKKLGYIKDELRKMIKIEMFYFYMTILLLPLPIVIVAGIEFVIYENITKSSFIFLILLYMIPTVLSEFSSYHMYTKEVIK